MQKVFKENPKTTKIIQNAAAIYRFDPFRLDAATGTVSRDGVPVPVGQRGAALLLTLLQHANAVVSKQDLMEAAWPGLAVEDANLSVQIAALRKALDDDVIQTVPRRGYRFTGTLVPPDETRPVASGIHHGDRPSIAVLPFENIGNDPEQVYFSDGLTRELIGGLSKFSALFVIAANSSFRYRASAPDVGHIAAELRVRYLLEGSVQRAGTRVRVSARLIDTATGTHLWADRYDRDIADLLTLQDEVAREIAGITSSHVAYAERERVSRKPPASWQAYDYYLKASEPSWRGQKALFERAEAMAQKAVELDPDFAPAHILRASFETSAWTEPRGGMDRFLNPATLDRAYKFAWTGLSLDPTLAEGHAALAWILLWRGEVDRALESYERAFALNPNLVDYLYAQTLIIAGRARDALAVLNDLTRRDPLCLPFCYAFYGHAYFFLGEDAKALTPLRECCSRTTDFSPGYVWLAAVCARLGRTEEAEQAVAEALRIRPTLTISQWRGMHPYRDKPAAEELYRWLEAAGAPA